jgi:hypothetical protein
MSAQQDQILPSSFLPLEEGQKILFANGIDIAYNKKV